MKPALTLAVQRRHAGWAKAIPGLTGFARAVALAAHQTGIDDGSAALTGDVTLAFAADEAVKPLNRDFRGKDKPTNVLSFPGVSGGGDVIFGFETIAREAEEQGKPLRNHAAHLIAHGILHLMGYDHMTPGAAKRMERLERRVMERFAIPDPYVTEKRS